MRYLERQQGKVCLDDRAEKYAQKPAIFWFSGLSGSGKTTIAIEFEKWLFDQGYKVFHLDADDLRKGLNNDLGFSMADRAENIRRASHAARLLQEAGLIVLATFISPTREMRNQARGVARENLFIEVFVKAKLETCMKRDPKGFYQKAMDGKISDYTGLGSDYEPPENEELLLDTDELDLDACLKRLIQFANNKGIIRLDA
jgi:adenylyl-sulfate kinase